MFILSDAGGKRGSGRQLVADDQQKGNEDSCEMRNGLKKIAKELLYGGIDRVSLLPAELRGRTSSCAEYNA